jgi:hypothetical protein
MRLLLFLLGFSVGIGITGNRAVAQNYPWCAQYSGGGGAMCKNPPIPLTSAKHC